MMLLSRLKIGKFFKRTSGILGKQAFLSFLVILFLEILFAATLFYQFSLTAKNFQPAIFVTPLQFDEELVEKILREWTEQQKIFEETEKKQYQDIFLRVSLPPETLE